MTQDDRVTIKKCLDAKTTLCHIAQELGKDPTTIAKEIKNHRTFQRHVTFNNKPNRCALAPYDYHCKLTDKAPYVCNGCQKKAQCRLDKYFYRATKAQKEYKTILSESRTGINLSEEELTLLDETIFVSTYYFCLAICFH